MAAFIAVMLFLLPLSSPFGEATATAASADDGLRLEVSVEIEGSPVAVVVRGVGLGESELPPVALANRGDGVWEGIVEMPVVENILLGFEIIPGQGPATVSEMHTLTELGVDRAIFQINRPPTGLEDDDEEPLVTPEAQRWGWLGLAAGTAALTLIALWTVGSIRSRRESPEADEALAPDESDEIPVD